LHIAAAILRRADEIVLVRQAAPGEQAFWALPGGVIEDGELVPEGLVREVREETGLTIADPVRLAFVVQIDDRRGVVSSRLGTEHGYTATVWTFEAENWRGGLCPADPDGFVAEARFVSLQDAIARLERTAWLSTTASFLRGDVEAGSVRFERRYPDGDIELVSSVLFQAPRAAM
jgi:8-oxo-dGTP diphosphatase